MSINPVLPGADRSGVYRAPRGVVTLAKQVSSARMGWLELKLGRVGTKQQFLAACARQLEFPEHFGGNWDALADCLREVDVCGDNGCVLHVQNAARFAKAAPDDYATALEILRLAADYWKDKRVLFLALVDGDASLPQL